MKRLVPIPSYVARVLTELEARGFQAFCVGGCVRDCLLGRVPEDWDVTTSALPEQTMALFGQQAVPTGLRHGTVTVVSGGKGVEVTTFRVDGAYGDNRHPDSVTFTRSLPEDLARRDFTVNAMAMDLRGRIQDPWGGQADLERRCLRCVGEPERRFREDALRVMRGLRFSAVLGFDLEEETAAALVRCRELLGHIAVERLREELVKLLCGPQAAQVLRRWPQVVEVILPEIGPLVGFDQHNRHHCYDVWEHTLHVLDAVEPVPVLRCAALFHDMGKPECFALDEAGGGHFMGHPVVSRRIAEAIMTRLRFDNATREQIALLVEWHDHRI
ncbi:MAG: HD domain-containing protein, partial [Oscillospiraceae bacterium]|nr:HD domain-containing protein [Oscillospiraceae bacterium]